MNYAQGTQKLLKANSVDMSQVICAWDQRWSGAVRLAVWHGVLFPGLQGGRGD